MMCGALAAGRRICDVKPLPPGLPPANSRKWATRRSWDQLGYLRVRSLANPNWPSDERIPWLITWLRREAETADAADRPLYGEAVTAAQRYRSAARRCVAAAEAWSDVLAPIDELLTRRQARHLDRVRQRVDADRCPTLNPPQAVGTQ